jgi:hypothetical protein
MNVHGKKVYKPPLEIIELQPEGATLSVTELMEVVKRVAGDLERSVADLPGGRIPTDSLIHIDVEFRG